jgi:uncharacterized protein YycO
MKEFLYDRWKGFLTWFGDIYVATKPPLCTAIQITDLTELMEAGDVVCRGYNYYLDGKFIPGDYTHSGIIINAREMIHSVAEGVQSIHPIDFIKDTDRFILLRPNYAANDKVFLAIDRAIWHCDCNETEYDFTFEEDGKYYCHEFTCDCLAQAGIVVNKTTKEFGVWPCKFKRNLYLAQNLIDTCKTIYEFNPKGGR